MLNMVEKAHVDPTEDAPDWQYVVYHHPPTSLKSRFFFRTLETIHNWRHGMASSIVGKRSSRQIMSCQWDIMEQV